MSSCGDVLSGESGTHSGTASGRIHPCIHPCRVYSNPVEVGNVGASSFVTLIFALT